MRYAFVFVLAVTLAIATGGSARAISALVPARACSDGGPGGAAYSLADGFAHAIGDAKTLRFFARVVSYDAAARRAVRARIAKLDPLTNETTEAELGCATELSYRMIRGSTLLESAWGLDASDRDFDPFAKRLERALAALDDAAALAPFGLRASDLAAPPAGATDCANGDRDAHTVRVHQPAYPAVARANRTAGLVKLEVALDREGFVRTVTVLDNTAGDGLAARTLADESILAAALTTYEPRIVNCVPSPGTYLFRADYSGR